MILGSGLIFWATLYTWTNTAGYMTVDSRRAAPGIDVEQHQMQCSTLPNLAGVSLFLNLSQCTWRMVYIHASFRNYRSFSWTQKANFLLFFV